MMMITYQNEHYFEGVVLMEVQNLPSRNALREVYIQNVCKHSTTEPWPKLLETDRGVINRDMSYKTLGTREAVSKGDLTLQ